MKIYLPGLDYGRRLYAYRSLLWLLTRRTIQNRYAGTGFGMLWSVAQPVMTVAVYWFVFSVGFKVRPMGDMPFIAVFLCGFIPWAMFSETLMANVHAVTGNSHLVKKTVFPTEILPIVNLMASTFVHGVMAGVLLIVLRASGVPLSFWALQALYYWVGLALLSLGLGWLCSAANVFYRDMGPMLPVVLSMWFWLTPIAWMLPMIPERWRWVVELNPLFYVTEGYRASFIYRVPFWRHGGPELYFWILCVGTVLGGGWFFRRLKSEFADAL